MLLIINMLIVHYIFLAYDSRLQEKWTEIIYIIKQKLRSTTTIKVGNKLNSNELANQFKENFENYEFSFKFDFIKFLAKKIIFNKTLGFR